MRFIKAAILILAIDCCTKSLQPGEWKYVFAFIGGACAGIFVAMEKE